MTAIERRDFWEPFDADSPDRAAGAARRLCVVSRNPLQSGMFIAGLATSVGSQGELEIIVDRRQGSSMSGPPSIERRRRPSIDGSLERDGFAIVPMPPAAAGRDTSPWHVPMSRPTGEAELEESYEQKLERLVRFEHRRLVRLSRWFIFSVLVSAVLFLLLVTPVIRSAFRQAPPSPPASPLASPAPHVADSPASPAATR
jgi:hypothetical protein